MKKLWISFALVIGISFAVLGWVGYRIYLETPPIPDRIVTADQTIVAESGAIQRGQNVWQAMGGMELGSVWGHGSYVAPDWTADWLHRECVFALNSWAQKDFGQAYEALGAEDQARLQKRLELMMRKNTYDPALNVIVYDTARAAAYADNERYYADLFSKGSLPFAIPAGAQSDPAKLKDLAAFFAWTAWAASTNRPNSTVTYTQNWPHEKLISNYPTPGTIVWTGVSILFLLGGICGMIWYYASGAAPKVEQLKTDVDPLIGSTPTPSQLATIKYFLVVGALIAVQILAGIVTAHYGVEGDGFYGIKLSSILPYSVTRTWHVQLGLFWIATAWLAAGIFMGPVVSGKEIKGQRLLVNILFVALLIIVAGSLTGQWLSIQNKLSASNAFLWGHQGYEYVDLGRIWQIGLFVGLLIWLFLMLRSVLPTFRQKGTDQKDLLGVFLLATTAIAGFYGAGLMWGQHTPLSIVEYWRWWVVHLWVEGFFEVFATAVIALFFSRLRLVDPRFAAKATLLSATIYLAGGIIGTLHHLYFSGTPSIALAFGAVFSALEVVPLVLVGYAAWEDLRLAKSNPWIQNYKWPIYFFVSVAFWNMLGAGLFGFMINPPIALYYMQGLNTTPVHGHAALFGVYGMLGIGLMLFCLKALRPDIKWRDKWMRLAFWGMNIGLFVMVTFSLLPVGLLQTWASVKVGYWYARSPEFLQTPIMSVFRWLRVPGDTIFALGALILVAFVFAEALRTKAPKKE